MGVSNNVLAGLGAGLQGGLRVLQQQQAFDEERNQRTADNDLRLRALQRSIMRDELEDLRHNEQVERELTGTIAQTYSQRPDAQVSAQDAARLRTGGYGAMLRVDAAPADQSEFNSIRNLMAPGVTPQSATATESFVRPTEQQVAQRQAQLRQQQTFDDADRAREQGRQYQAWIAANPTASPQQRYIKAQEFGQRFAGLSPDELAAEERRKEAFQRSLATIRHNEPTPRSTEGERLFRENPWEAFKQEALGQLRGSMSSLASQGLDANQLLTQIDQAATEYANQRYAAWLQGQRDAGKLPAPGGAQGNGAQRPPANSPRPNTPMPGGQQQPQAQPWYDSDADFLVGVKPGEKADPKKVIALLQSIQGSETPENMLAAVKWAKKHGVNVNFGGGQ